MWPDTGLSPHVRGNPAAARAAGEAHGSIPARAGEPVPSFGTERRRGVYPRTCGGTGSESTKLKDVSGLSPHVRGNPVPSVRVTELVGSIPARAGEPDRDTRATIRSEVYPRTCGGTSESAYHRSPDRGLSPHVRGNRPLGGPPLTFQRSIPARAGEPRLAISRRGRRRVYPRTCGGTAHLVARPWPSRGLSPHVRGNPSPSVRAGGASGSIPARAGEPQQPPHGGRLLRVYPRTCGGTRLDALGIRGPRGLSPHVRGNPGSVVVHVVKLGSIPARAGEPGSPGTTGRRGRVYPRTCGGTHGRDRTAPPGWGLSPHVRGNP